jgi:mRNA interferase HigB
MQVIARRTLRLFWERHPQAEGPLRAWFSFATAAHWKSPSEVKRQFGTTVDFMSDNRAIFDVGGNKYRLVVHISYVFGRVLVNSWAPTPNTTALTRRQSHGEENDSFAALGSRIRNGAR